MLYIDNRILNIVSITFSCHIFFKESSKNILETLQWLINMEMFSSFLFELLLFYFILFGIDNQKGADDESILDGILKRMNHQLSTPKTINCDVFIK